jgi:uncharacterized RDD family membrane protein YckC
MRCPKCHYISFDNGERCRNCGYDFSLAVDAGAVDLPIHASDAPEGPMGDFALGGGAASAGGRAEGAAPGPGRRAPATDLPLFTDRIGPDDAPLVTPPAVPRPPLAVRRSNPAVPRPRARAPQPQEPRLDLGAPEARRERSHSAQAPAGHGAAGALTPPADLAPRLLAGVIDLAIVGSIHAAVIHFTLRLCGLGYEEIRVLPPVPLASFLLLLAGGYFVSFVAAGGQTIGKMVSGIRVVPTPDADVGSERVPFGSAVVRAAASLVSILAAGAGFLPALFSADHRALHDRLADTRVVRT